MSKKFKSKPSEKQMYAIRDAIERLRNRCEESNTKAGKRMYKALDKCSDKLAKINIGNDTDN